MSMNKTPDSENSIHAVKKLYLHMAFGFSTLVLVLMLVVALAGTGYYRRIMEKNNTELETIITDILSNAISRISFSGKYHSQLLVEQLMKSQPRLNFIIITDNNDRIIAHSSPELIDTTLAEPRRSIAREVMSSDHAQSHPFSFKTRNGTEIAVPFRSGYRNEVTGVMFVGISSRELSAAIRYSHWQIITLIGMLAGVSLLGTYLLCRHFVAPVKAMALQLKGLLDFAPLLICIAGKDGKILHGSALYSQVRSRSDSDFMAEELAKVFEGREMIRNELNQWVGWHEEHFLTTSFPICRDRGNRITQACAIALDVTELKKTMEALKESEDRYRNLFDKSSDAMLLIDGDQFTACNQAAIRMFGYSSETDIIHKTPFYLSPPLQPDRQQSSLKMFEYLNRAQQDGYCRFEWFHQRANGEVFPAEVSLTSIPRGTRCLLHVIMRDISERKRAEQALREQEENLRITLDSIGDAVIAADRDGNIIRINPVAARIIGTDGAQAVGKPLTEILKLVDPASREIMDDPIKLVLNNTALPAALTGGNTLMTSDGKFRLIAASGAPIRNEKAEIVGVVLVFRDITEQNRLEEQFRQSQKMESIGHLAGGIAHDFNNMLAGIMGAASLLSRRLKDNPPLKSSADLILEAANLAAGLTRKLLDFSRKGKIISTPVGVHQIINDTVQLLQRSLDKQIEIKFALGAANDTVIGDPAQLQNALLNLAINSRDAMPEGGVLSFSTANFYLDHDFCRTYGFELASGNYLEIDVTDTGIGMSREVMSRIFEPFFTTKEAGSGTGLGLSSVYGTVMAHHGQIHCYSEPGQGTVFKIFLPSETSERPVHEVSATNETISLGKGCIMVVDDEELVRKMACDILDELGYETLPACNGQEAAAILEREKDRIDLVLLDMVMPRLSGREVYAMLKKIKPDLKVVFSSGFTRDHSFDELIKEPNVKGFLQKPYMIVDLSETVAQALKGSPANAGTETG